MELNEKQIKMAKQDIVLSGIYSIRLGDYCDKYVATDITPFGVLLRRVRLPKTKIDRVRLPESITITFEGHCFPTKNVKK